MTTESAPDVVNPALVRAPIDLDRVYREHAATVSRWVRRLSGSNDASDTLQEVFEVAQRRLASFRGDAQLTTWLYSITVRVVSARRRKERFRRLLFLRAASEAEAYTAQAQAPDQSLRQQQAQRVVYAVLNRMSERDRTLLILFELERLSTHEIGLILELNANNVAVSMHRARERFRKLLHVHFPDEAGGMDHGQTTA